MNSFRGDAHKLYLKLRKASDNKKSVNELEEVIEIHDIERFYEKLSDSELRKIRYRMLKEKHGTGVIPILVTSLPWLAFIFSEQLQSWLFKDGSHLWLGFIFVYALVIMVSIVIHYREKAWASVHTEIIKDILSKRNQNN